jgi:A/G-specific adenine glycosylase
MTGSPDLGAITARLLSWYERNQRELPWRNTRDPYLITVAEFMLHQTRVATVLPYYQRFLERFPDWSALASAPLDDVLKAWEGLGYYARARHLHGLAQCVSAEHGGELPNSDQALRALPGIGEYTAGAILSIAFGQDRVAIDGNVRRVLCRLFQITENPVSADGRQRLQQSAESLLPHGQAGAFNQALMDLASSVCTPRRPMCEVCPLSEACQARRLGTQESLPVRRPTRRIPHYDIAAAVIWREGCILITKRPLRGLLGGLWEFPGGKREPRETLEACLAREIREELGIEIEIGAHIATVEHAYTHFRITLYAYDCRYAGGEPRCLGCDEWKWVQPPQLRDYAFPAANHPILAALQTAQPARVDGA